MATQEYDLSQRLGVLSRELGAQGYAKTGLTTERAIAELSELARMDTLLEDPEAGAAAIEDYVQKLPASYRQSLFPHIAQARNRVITAIQGRRTPLVDEAIRELTEDPASPLLTAAADFVGSGQSAINLLSVALGDDFRQAASRAIWGDPDVVTTEEAARAARYAYDTILRKKPLTKQYEKVVADFIRARHDLGLDPGVPDELLEQYGEDEEGRLIREPPTPGRGAAQLAGLVAGASMVGGPLVGAARRIPMAGRLFAGRGLAGEAARGALGFGAYEAGAAADPGAFVPGAAFGAAMPVGTRAFSNLGKRMLARVNKAALGSPSAEARKQLFSRLGTQVGLGMTGRGAAAAAKGYRAGPADILGRAARYTGRIGREYTGLTAGEIAAEAARAAQGKEAFTQGLTGMLFSPDRLGVAALFGLGAKVPGRAPIVGPRSRVLGEVQPTRFPARRGILEAIRGRRPAEITLRGRITPAARRRIRAERPTYRELPPEKLAVVTREERRRKEAERKRIPYKPSPEYERFRAEYPEVVEREAFRPTRVEREAIRRGLKRPIRAIVEGRERLARRILAEEGLLSDERLAGDARLRAFVEHFGELMRRERMGMPAEVAPVAVRRGLPARVGVPPITPTEEMARPMGPAGTAEARARVERARLPAPREARLPVPFMPRTRMEVREMEVARKLAGLRERARQALERKALPVARQFAQQARALSARFHVERQRAAAHEARVEPLPETFKPLASFRVTPTDKYGRSVTDPGKVSLWRKWAKEAGKRPEEVFDAIVKVAGGWPTSKKSQEPWRRLWKGMRTGESLDAHVAAWKALTKPYYKESLAVVEEVARDADLAPTLRSPARQGQLADFLAQSRAAMVGPGYMLHLNRGMQRLIKSWADAPLREMSPLLRKSRQARAHQARLVLNRALDRADLLNEAKYPEVFKAIRENPQQYNALANKITEAPTPNEVPDGSTNWEAVFEYLRSSPRRTKAVETIAGERIKEMYQETVDLPADALSVGALALGERRMWEGKKQQLVDHLVEVKVLERVGGEKIIFTERGQKLVSDLVRHLKQTSEYLQAANHMPSWFRNPYTDWLIECASPCQGLSKFMTKLFKEGRLLGYSGDHILYDMMDGRGERFSEGKIARIYRMGAYPLRKLLPRSWAKIVGIGDEGHRQRNIDMRKVEDIFPAELRANEVRLGNVGKGWEESPAGKRLTEIFDALNGELAIEGIANAADRKVAERLRDEVFGPLRTKLVQELYRPLREAAERADRGDLESLEMAGHKAIRKLVSDLVRVRQKDGTIDRPGKGIRDYLLSQPKLVLEAIKLKETLGPGEFKKLTEHAKLDLVVHGWGIRNYAPWNLAKMFVSATDVEEKAKLFSDKLIKVRDADGNWVEVKEKDLAKLNMLATTLPHAQKAPFFKHQLQRLSQGDATFGKDVYTVAQTYVRGAYRKMVFDRTTEAARDDIYGEYKPIDTSTETAWLEELRNVPSRSTVRDNVPGHEVADDLLLEARGFLPHPKRFPVRGGPYRFAMGNPGKNKKGETIVTLYVRGADNLPLRLTRKQFTAGKFFVRKGGQYGMLTEFDAERAFKLVSKWAFERTAQRPADFKGPHGKVVDSLDTAMRTTSEVMYHAQLGGIVNFPAAMTNYLEGTFVVNLPNLGLSGFRRGFESMRGWHKVSYSAEWQRLANEGLNDREIMDRLSEHPRFRGTAWAENYRKYLKNAPFDISGVMESHHLDYIQARSGHLLKFPGWKEKKERMSRLSMHMFGGSELFVRQHAWFGAIRDVLARYNRIENGNVPLVSPTTGEHYEVVLSANPKRGAGTKESPHEISAYDYALHVLDRTHFIYRRSLHPGLMRIPGWPYVGHLQTYSSRQMFESFENMGSVFRATKALAQGKDVKEKDVANTARAIRQWGAGVLFLYLIRELTGMDVSFYSGRHPSEYIFLRDHPETYDLPEWTRFMPGSLPLLNRSKSLPLQAVETVGDFSWGMIREIPPIVRGEEEITDVLSARMRAVKENARWAPELGLEGGLGWLGDAVGFFFPRGPGRWIEFMRNLDREGVPQGFLHTGSKERPRQYSFGFEGGLLGRPGPARGELLGLPRVGEAISRLFLPGGVYAHSQAWKEGRRELANRQWLDAMKRDLRARYMDPDTPREEKIRLREKAREIGYDLVTAAKSAAKFYGVPRHLRHFSAGPILSRTQMAIASARRYTEEDRRIIHRMVMGKRAPFNRDFWRSEAARKQVRALVGVRGGRELLKKYVEAMFD